MGDEFPELALWAAATSFLGLTRSISWMSQGSFVVSSVGGVMKWSPYKMASPAQSGENE